MKKFYTYMQNNSGGRFVMNTKHGVCAVVIVEANSAKEADERLHIIGDNVDDFYSYCECCGSRWEDFDEDLDECSEKPTIFDEPTRRMGRCSKEKIKSLCDRDHAYVHPLEGKFYSAVIKKALK